MRSAPKLLKLLVVYFLISAPAIAQSNWSKASDCFNAGDFKCAFETAIELAREGRIAVGNDDRTTDSMTFLQMAFVEYASRATDIDLISKAGTVITTFGQSENRLPFIWGFAIISALDACADKGDVCDRLEVAYCSASAEFPPPTWRPLVNINQLSEIGQSYFDRVMQSKPDCWGA